MRIPTGARGVLSSSSSSSPILYQRIGGIQGKPLGADHWVLHSERRREYRLSSVTWCTEYRVGGPVAMDWMRKSTRELCPPGDMS